MIIALSIIYLAFTVSGLILMKLGLTTFEIVMISGKLSITMGWKLILGITMYILSFLTWMTILQKFDLSYIYPILTGIVYICVLLSSYFILNERISTYNIVGSIVILVGVILINIK